MAPLGAHIHAPGTAMNRHFTWPTAWADYLDALEKATPAIEAIAVIDRQGSRWQVSIISLLR